MVRLEVNGDTIDMTVLGSHVLWALKRSLSVKCKHVLSVTRADPALRPPWLRCPGTAVPGVICAGTYLGKGRKEFWDTRFKGNAVRIELRDERYTRLVVDVADPEETIKALSKH